MTTSVLEQIQELELQIRQLKVDAILEMKEKLAVAHRRVSALEIELVKFTEKSAPTETIRIRRGLISDEDLKGKIHELFVELHRFL